MTAGPMSAVGPVQAAEDGSALADRIIPVYQDGVLVEETGVKEELERSMKNAHLAALQDELNGLQARLPREEAESARIEGRLTSAQSHGSADDVVELRGQAERAALRVATVSRRIGEVKAEIRRAKLDLAVGR